MISDLRRERDRFVAFAFATAHLLIETDSAGIISFAAGSACGLIAGSADDLIGRRIDEFIAARDQLYFQQLMQRIVTAGAVRQMRVRLVGVATGDVEFFLGGCYIDSAAQSLHFALSVAGSDQAAPQQTDDGLSQNEDFTRAARNHLAGGSKDQGLTLLVVDGLARIAATQGSDAVKTAADRIAAFLRSVSIGGDRATTVAPGRYGIIPAPGVTEAEIHQQIDHLLTDAGIPSNVVSFSIAFDKQGLTEADAARALAYSIQRFAETPPAAFSVRSLRDGAQQIIAETTRIIGSFRRVLDENQFDLVFQPIVSMQDGTVHHLEALSRISGVSSIASCMRFAENSGMIQDFDLAVAQKAIENLDSHAARGWYPVVAVNLSARSLQSPIFMGQFQHLIQARADLIHQMMLEITETVAIGDFNVVARIIDGLRRNGHRICIDDVGAGTTSFQSLCDLKVDFLKIDGELVRRAADRGDTTVLSAITRLATATGVQMIAEQIETAEQARMMQSLGIRFGQGYLYGRPATDFTIWRNRFAPHTFHDPQWQPIDRPQRR
ncbi:MAG: EAL domain-containing protein [Azospirillaceae bacterium]|nr:EAL domain-containing protein [Azospirillaceae bacterium]